MFTSLFSLSRLVKIILLTAFFLTPLFFDPGLYLTFELPKAIFFRVLTLFAGLIFVVHLFFAEQFSFPKIPRFFWITFLGIIFFYVLATFFSVAPEASFWGSYYRLQGLFTFLHYWLLFALIFIFFEKRHVSLVVKGFMLSGFLVALFGVIQWFFPSLSGFWDVEFFLGRIFSTLGHPNFLGAFLVFNFPLYLNEIFQNKGIARWISIFGMLILLLALFLTLSRAAILGTMIAGFVFLFLMARHLRIKKILILSFLIPLIILIPLAHRFYLQDENARSVNTRLAIWPAVIQQISDYPWLGSGPETFSLTFPRYAPAELLYLENFDQAADRAHNEILDLAVSIGIPGTLLYLLFLTGVLWLCFRSQNPLLYALGCGLLGLFIAHQFGFPGIVHSMLFWSSVALIFLMLFEKRDVSFSFLKKYWVSFPLLVASFIGFFFYIIFFVFHPYRADYLFREAYDQSRDGKFSSAIQLMQEADDLYPHQFFYNLNGAELTLRLAEIMPLYDSLFPAEKFLNHLGSFTNFSEPAYYLLKGKFLHLQDQNAEAFEAFQAGYALSPRSPQLLLEWGKTLLDTGFYNDAIAKFEEYLSLAPKYWQWKGRKDLTHGQQEKLRIFYKLNPDFDVIFDLLVEAARKAGNIEKIERYKPFIIIS